MRISLLIKGTISALVLAAAPMGLLNADGVHSHKAGVNHGAMHHAKMHHHHHHHHHVNHHGGMHHKNMHHKVGHKHMMKDNHHHVHSD